VLILSCFRPFMCFLRTSLGVVGRLVGTSIAGVVLAPEFPFMVGELCCTTLVHMVKVDLWPT
jgi:hypothetical protein